MNKQRVKRTVWLVMCVGAIALAVLTVKGAENNGSQGKSGAIKLTFIEEGKLSKAEVDQVVALAKQCGLTNVAEIETFDFQCGQLRGICVKSIERKKDRNIFFDLVYMSRTGWLEPEAGAEHLGEFWVWEPSLSKISLRQFEVNGKTALIQLGDTIDANFADRIISQLGAKKVRFEQEFWRETFEGLDMAEARSFYKSRWGRGYEIRFYDPIRIVHFIVDKDIIVVTSVDI